MKLHIGCGSVIIPGWVNLDIQENPGVDLVDDATVLQTVPDESCSVIYASHVLEHFGRNQVSEILNLWCRKLKKGGTLRLAVPDFAKVTEVYQKTHSIENVLGLVIGGHKNNFDVHGMIFDQKNLTSLLLNTGFYDVRHWDWRNTEHHDKDDYSQAYFPHMQKSTGTLMSLNLEAVKR